ncbi:MAG: glycosyltransferase family 4 protein [bacterium]
MHITHIFPMFKEVHGGAEPVIFNLLKYLTNQGIRNALVTPYIPEDMRQYIDPRVEIISGSTAAGGSRNILLQGFINLLTTSFLSKKIPNRTDAVCFHTETVIPALFTYMLRGRKRPAVYFCYQPPRFAYDTGAETAQAGGLLGKLIHPFSAVYRPFDKFAVRKVDQVFTFSSDYKAWIESIYSIDGVRVIPPGVKKPDKIDDLPEETKSSITESGPIILFVGKLVPWKNIDRLINITGLLKKRFPGIRLLIVGDGPSMPFLGDHVRSTGLSENVIFAGYVGSKDVFSYYSAADLFVILEKNISFGLCLVEANSCGLPVVAFRAGGPVDIIDDGKNGFLLPNNATDEFIASTIAVILKDSEGLAESKKHSISRSSKFTWENFAKMFAEGVSPIIGD